MDRNDTNPVITALYQHATILLGCAFVRREHARSERSTFPKGYHRVGRDRGTHQRARGGFQGTAGERLCSGAVMTFEDAVWIGLGLKVDEAGNVW